MGIVFINKIHVHSSVFQLVICAEQEICKKQFQKFRSRMNAFLQIGIVCSDKCITKIPRVFTERIVVHTETKGFHIFTTSPQLGEKLLTVEKVGREGGDSKNQVLRYIRLTYLIPELLSQVDDGKIAFNPAVEISYLEHSEQRVLLDAMELNDCTPSHAQAIRLKNYSKEGLLTDEIIYDVISEDKPNQQEQIKFRRDELRQYFPPTYTDEQIRKDVIKGLELLKRQRERNRDAR